MNLTLEKHFMKLFFHKNDKLNIKFFQKIFSYAFNTINAVKMCSDSQGLSSIPSDLLAYVLRIVKM